MTDPETEPPIEPAAGSISDDGLSPAEQAIHMASSFYAELTMNAASEEALVEIVEKLSPDARRTNFITACGLKSNFTKIGNLPLELVEYAETAINHLNDIVYCHAALLHILRADAANYKFADEIELNNKVQKTLDGITEELFDILSEEEGGTLMDEDDFAERLWQKLNQEY